MAVSIYTEDYSWCQQKLEIFAAQLSNIVPLIDKNYSKVWLERTEIFAQAKLNSINNLNIKIQQAGFFKKKGTIFCFEIDLIFLMLD